LYAIAVVVFGLAVWPFPTEQIG